MTCARRGKKVADDSEIVSIIENEQPVCVIFEPPFDRINSAVWLLLALFYQVQQNGNGHEIHQEILARVGLHPKHGLIFMLVAIGVFHGSLGLANTSKAADSLWRSLRVRQCKCKRSTKSEPLANPKVSHWPYKSAILERNF